MTVSARLRLMPLCLSVLALAVPDAALATFRMIEQAIEANAEQIVLPKSVGAPLLVRSCPTCAARSLKTTASTRFLVGDQAIPLRAFARFLMDHPKTDLAIMTSVRDGTVTRIKATSTAGFGPATPTD